jgi:methylmalonyl-CoA mutase C-terminal domain/subunit
MGICSMGESMTEPRIRCLLGKVGLDGHQRGVHVIARAWRDAGFEVIYMGLRNSPAEFAAAAVDEGVDVVGVSVLSGAHLHTTKETRAALDAAGLDDVPLIVGGVIPAVDVQSVLDAGAAMVLGPGSTLDAVSNAVYIVLKKEQLV